MSSGLASFRPPGISSLIPTFGTDVVAIYKTNEVKNDQILDNTNPIQAQIIERANYFKHPLESGRNITDHRIIEPVEIELRLLLVPTSSIYNINSDFVTTAADIYNQIKTLFLEGSTIAIQTRTGVYTNQIIQEMPHEETSNIFDGIIISFKSSELLTSQILQDEFNPENELDESTQQKGKQNPVLQSAIAAASILAGIALVI